MSIDLTKLSPSPWEFQESAQTVRVKAPNAVVGKSGMVKTVCLQSVGSKTGNVYPTGVADLHFIALARNAFAVWMAHPSWSVESCMDDQHETWWRVIGDDGQQLGEPQRDPYSALLSAGNA